MYTASPGTRVHEALEKAVPKPTADMRHLDLARVMFDEETILVPAVGSSRSQLPCLYRPVYHPAAK